MKKLYFPMFVDLSKQKILVIGGGKIAARRVETLLLFASDILVVAPDVTERIEELAKRGEIRLDRAVYEKRMLEGADLTLAATDQPACNEQVAADCKEMGIPVNVSHSKELCDFYFPGIARRENVVVGVTASGGNHRQARRIREAVERVLEELDGEDIDE